MRGITSGRALALLGVIVVAGLATQASVALAVAPAVATQAATGVTIQAATLRGTVNPRSLATSVRLPVRPDHGLRRADRAGLARGGRRGGPGHGCGGRPRPGHHLPLPPRRDERDGHLGDR